MIQSSLQVGDGSGLVIALGGELLQQAETLLHMGLHPSDIVDGFVQAAAKADAILDGVRHSHAQPTSAQLTHRLWFVDLSCKTVAAPTEQDIVGAVKTCFASKKCAPQLPASAAAQC